MHWVAILVLAIALSTAAASAGDPASQPPAPRNRETSQPPQQIPDEHSNKADADQRGTESSPFVVKTVLPPKSEQEAAQDAADREEKASSDWWMELLTAAIASIGFVQTIVFWIQAGRLKQTIRTMGTIADGQTADMQASIKQASRAAAAMEIAAQGISANVETSKSIAETQREFWKIQMRAYVSVRYAITVPQNHTSKWRTEIRLQIVNTGHTPAYELFYKSWCDIFPFPLPENFDFHIPNLPDQSAGTLAPGQHFIIAASVPRVCSEIEVADYVNGSERRIYMYGVVIYKDVFGCKHETRFSQSVIWFNDGSTMGVNTRRHNHAD